jgi:hypothetical protein
MATYPKGIMVFSPHSSAPSFVKGSIVISLNELVQFCKENPDLLTEYEGKKQLKLQLKEGNKGLYCEVDTYKKGETKGSKKEESSDLPF